MRALRMVWGALLLLMPSRLIAFGGGHPTRLVIATARVLGVRHLVEALWMAIAGERRPPRWTVAVDAAHGASMVAVAARSRRYRHDALMSAATAGVLAAISEVERRR